MSGEDAGLDVNLAATVDPAGWAEEQTADTTGLPHGRLLIDFAEAVVRATDDIEPLRSRLLDEVGPDATGHAAATIAAFSGLVRVADGTGIPVDDGLAAVSVSTIEELALAKLGGAANSNLDDIAERNFADVESLFSNS